MYTGHLILLLILICILIVSFKISKKKKKTFIYTCRVISIIFLLISLIYYLDVFVNNPTTEGYKMTWSMYLLGQNEDFLIRNGKFFGLYWSVGIAIMSLVISVIPIKHKNRI